MTLRLPRPSVLFFVFICLLAFFLRTFNTNWDRNQHLHPDERFLTMVMGSMVLPASFHEYISPELSKLNPVNIGYEFYVYGTFPLVMNKLLAIVFHNDSYNDLTIQGRWLSASMDLVTLISLMLFVRTLQVKHKFSHQLKYLTGFLYAIFVFPIQQSHFFTTDTFSLAFFMLSLWFASRSHLSKIRIFWIACSALFFGLSLASKINGVFCVPLVCWFIFDPMRLWTLRKKKKQLFSAGLIAIAQVLVWGLVVWLTIRIAEPYYFAQFSLIDLHLHPTFLKNIETLKSFSDPNGYFPPSIQWMSKTPVLFPLVNIAVFGIGLPLFFLVMYGIGSLIRSSIFRLKERIDLLVLLVWMICFSLYQGIQFVSTMRYFFFLYPFFAFFAALGIVELARRVSLKTKINHSAKIFLYAGVLFVCSLWTLMFMSIYVRQNSRVAASRWLYQVIPDKSDLTMEHWDDPLPLQIEGFNPSQKTFTGGQLPVFYPDTDDKWKEMDKILNETDYYVITSNRGWGSIMALPDKFPRTTKFYQQLFAGETQYEKIGEFSSYPSLSYLGIPITLNDDWAEEAFTVYDHPKVMVFGKNN